MDCCIRVFDILTGTLVDWLKFQNAPLSIDFAPSGEFLATSHLNSKAVYLWSNKAFFSQVVIERAATAPVQIDLPHCDAMRAQSHSHKDFYAALSEKAAAGAEVEQPGRSLVQQQLAALNGVVKAREEEKRELLRRSDQPFSKWQAIFKLEQIKERNRPKLQKEALPKVPFFLFDLEKATTLEGG